MRPKVVLIILAAIGLMVAVGILVGTRGEREAQVAEANPATPGSEAGSVAAAAPGRAQPQKPALTNVDPAAQYEKDMDEIRDAAANGVADPLSLPTLLDKVTNPIPEVRRAALEAVQALNDTNAIPRLRLALTQLEDPHDKAAILDVIEYLQLPDVMDLPDPVASNAGRENQR